MLPIFFVEYPVYQRFQDLMLWPSSPWLGPLSRTTAPHAMQQALLGLENQPVLRWVKDHWRPFTYVPLWWFMVHDVMSTKLLELSLSEEKPSGKELSFRWDAWNCTPTSSTDTKLNIGWSTHETKICARFWRFLRWLFQVSFSTRRSEPPWACVGN